MFMKTGIVDIQVSDERRDLMDLWLDRGWDESEILTLSDNKINELHDIFTDSKILDFPLKGDNDNEN